MRKLSFLFVLLSCAIVFGQDETLKRAVNDLKYKIESSSQGDKLKLMDSLSTLVVYRPEFNYDSIVRATIDFAVVLDSFNLATKHMSNRIFFLSNRAGDPTRAKQVFDDFIAKELNISELALKAALYMNGGDSYFYSGEIEKAIDIYKTSSVFAQEANDSIVLSKSKIYASEALIGIGKFAEATLLLDESEEISRKTRDTSSIMIAEHMRANLYGSMGFIKEANKSRDHLIDLAKKRKNYLLLQSAYYNKAVDQDGIGDYESMITNLRKARFYVDKIDIPSEKNKILIALFRVYAKTDSLSKARTILDEIHRQPNFKSLASNDFNYIAALAKYELALGHTQKAIALQESLIDHSTNINVVNRLSIHAFLAEAYESIDPVKSYGHYKTYASMRDSINSIQNTKALAYYQTLYETEKRDFKIAEQASKIFILDKENTIKKQWMLFGGLGLFLGFAIIYLIRSRNYSRKEKRNQELFSQQLLKTQEQHRTKVASDLHDSVGQKLMLLTKRVKSFKDKDIDNLAKHTLNELRGISRSLYPATFEKLGVTASIESMINEVDANTNLFFTIDVVNIDDALSKKDALHLYRIIQEALNNTVKHAKAQSVCVNILRRGDAIETTIKDNGIGFNINEKQNPMASLGMNTLVERAKIIKSKLFIDSAKNKGTTLQLITPVCKLIKKEDISVVL